MGLIVVVVASSMNLGTTSFLPPFSRLQRSEEEDVLKDSVRVSVNLQYGLGYPVSGRTVFVYPVCSPSLNNTVNTSDGPLYTADGNRLSLVVCKELYLELIPFRNMVEVKMDLLSKEKFTTERSLGRYEIGDSTPKTPLNLQKLGSPGSNAPASPIIKDSVSSISNQRTLSANLVDMQEVLTSESAKKLFQTCATSWIYPCSLFYGNLVAVPVLSEICIFCVKKATKLPADNPDQNVATQASRSTIQTAESVHHANYAFLINQETKVYFQNPLDLANDVPEGTISQNLQLDQDNEGENVGHELAKLGGLSKEYAVLRDIIVPPSSLNNTLSRLGIRTAKGVLLHGPPGTGKTSLARLCARDSGVSFFSVNGPEIVGQYLGESEKALYEVFSSASKAAPSVVFIDELDAIAPARKERSEDLSQRMVATLLSLMDGINSDDGVVVVAATNRPDSIDPALRRHGRLDKEIEIGVPSSAQRLDILCTILSGMQHSLSDIQIQQLAMATHGFVGADLASLCNEAALVCLRRHVEHRSCSRNLHPEETPVCACKRESSDSSTNITGISTDRCHSASSCVTISPTASGAPIFSSNGAVSQATEDISSDGNYSPNQMCVTEREHILRIAFEDFEKAKMKIRPSAMREVILEIPKVNWDDIGGQNEVKNQLMEVVEWPQKHQDVFKRIGIKPPSKILMFGPPGCSKTLMARAVASEAGLNFFAVKGPELFSKWVGESEKAVRSLFAKARANAPSIIFFDEIDGLATIRGKENDGISVSDRVMGQLLVELDGLHQLVGVTVIAATNRPDKIDPALLRPGRFDRSLYVGPPNKTDREDIFKIHLRKIPYSSDVSLEELASLTEGWTGADISLICREAAIAALEESLDAEEITKQHLKEAIRQVEPTEILSYEELSGKFQRVVPSKAQEDLVENPESTSSRSSFSLWTRMRSIAMFLLRLVAS
ncbi:PREDICTED: calmodulin-interacting protein 111 isoform X2 [Tarenaya hassleriana]|uniref:calmodulin-interacting protein 111 isoform X2 n=1 Tax=Tarenaya hassleriana TaxID=28532 RepID=UPI00053C6269|nr:PREDICTED: calmodulin-interacting protein 111 isoform X2 [Tarenaya hassleriana]